MTSPTLLAPEISPSSPEDVWGPGNIFLHDWSDGFELTTSWPGSTNLGNTSAEKRTCLSDRPLRTARFSIHCVNSAESWALKNYLNRMAQCRLVVPIYSDQSHLAAAITAGDTVIYCDTTFRRFFVGGLVVIAAAPSNGTQIQIPESSTITAITDTTLTLTTPPTRNYTLGTRIIPLMVSDPWVTSDARKLNGGKLQIEIIAQEVSGDSGLPALPAPATFNTSNSYPLFDLGLRYDLAWTSVTEGWRRDNRVSSVGLGSSFDLFGPRPRAYSTRRAQATSRKTAWALLQFFDSARGQTLPFISPTPLPYFTLLSLTSTSCTAPAKSPLQDWTNYPYLVLVAAGSGPSAVTVIPITGVTRASGVDTITFASATVPALASLVCVTVANLMRFNSPDITETWRTTQNLSIEFSMIEVLNEGSITIEHLDPPDDPGIDCSIDFTTLPASVVVTASTYSITDTGGVITETLIGTYTDTMTRDDTNRSYDGGGHFSLYLNNAPGTPAAGHPTFSDGKCRWIIDTEPMGYGSYPSINGVGPSPNIGTFTPVPVTDPLDGTYSPYVVRDVTVTL